MQTNWKEQLHTLLNCDIRSQFLVARQLKRKLRFFVGPTNSGKTYQAMQSLQKSDCGLYLAPLRLLALEGYEALQQNGIKASLITGEEEVFDEDAAHVCSTIEMLDFNMEVDVAVIDEVQMLDDDQRGWAWVNAIIGTPAKEVIMTGSVNALEAIKKIAAYLGEELEVVKFKRKNPLEVLEHSTDLKHIKPYTALIAFSRNDVLKYKQKLSKYHEVSVIYGNLSPEVRKEEAKRFRQGHSTILVATDAIAMGLNLPIQTILFTTDTKFDGKRKRKITPNEIVQIAGRAGRYGLHEKGHIGAIKPSIHAHIKKEFHAPIKTIKPPYKIKATPSQIQELSLHLRTKNLTQILHFFRKNMSFDGPFIPANISSMLELASLLDSKNNLSLQEKFLFASAPVTLKSPLIKQAFLFYVHSLLKKSTIRYKPSVYFNKGAKTQFELLQAEDEVKKISMYLWLSYKFPEYFVDYDKAFAYRIHLNSIIEQALQKGIRQAPRHPTKKPPKKSYTKKAPRTKRRRNHTA